MGSRESGICPYCVGASQHLSLTSVPGRALLFQEAKCDGQQGLAAGEQVPPASRPPGGAPANLTGLILESPLDTVDCNCDISVMIPDRCVLCGIRVDIVF